MKMINKKIATLFLGIFFASAFLSALEWGGLIDDTTKISYSNETSSFFQSNGIYLWLKTPLSDDEKFTFSSEILYKYNLDISDLKKTSDSTVTNILDVDLLKLDGSWDVLNGGLSFALGRFYTSENSGVVFSQISDGLKFAFQNRFLEASVYGGYTGLLNSLNVSMTEENSNANNTQLYNLSAPFVPIFAGISFSKVGPFSAAVQAAYFLSLLKDIENRAYASLNLSGNLSTVGSLSFNFILGTYTFDGLMLFSNADFSFFLGNNFILSAGAEYASGLSDNNKILSFSPVTSRSVYSGLRSIDDLSYLAPNLGLTFVYNKLFAKLTEKTVISFGDDSKLFGLDSALSLKYNIFSDFQLGLSGALYFDFSESAYNNCSLTLSGGLEF